MNLDQIEEIRTIANILAEKLTPHPASILQVAFKRFYDEVDNALTTAVIDAYKNGELRRVVTEQSQGEKKA